MGRKSTHEEFLNKFYEKNENAQDIEVLGTYAGVFNKIKCRCKIDGYEWEPTPGNLLHAHGCPKCAGILKPTHEEFKEKLYEINTDIEILGT